MKKYFILMILFLLVGCAASEQPEKTTEGVVKEPEVKKTAGLITEKLSFEDEDMSGSVIKNKLIPAKSSAWSERPAGELA